MPGWAIMLVWVVLAKPMAFLAAFVTGEYTFLACSSLSNVVESLYSNLGISTLLLIYTIWSIVIDLYLMTATIFSISCLITCSCDFMELCAENHTPKYRISSFGLAASIFAGLFVPIVIEDCIWFAGGL